MGKFLTDLKVTIIDDQLAKLDIPLIFSSVTAGILVVVPAGFVTDFASVPRLPGIYLVLGGIAKEPAVVHDYTYRNGLFTRLSCDKIFEEAMRTMGIGFIRRTMLYLGVRVFGRPYWKGNLNKHKKEIYYGN